MAFADRPKNRTGPSRQVLGPHIFDHVCSEHGIAHRLTKPDHPWTSGQAGRMNRTIEDVTVKVFHSEDLASLKAHGSDGRIDDEEAHPRCPVWRDTFFRPA